MTWFDFVLPLLPWLGGALALVLAIWLAIHLIDRRRQNHAGDEFLGVFVPSSEPDPVDAKLPRRPRAYGALGRPILIGVTILALGIVAFLGYRSLLRDSAWSTAYVTAPIADDAASDPESRPRRATAEAGGPGVLTSARLEAWAGGSQAGRAGALLSRSLAVVLLDSAGRPVPNRVIRFEVPPGGGDVAPDSVRTSDSGLAATSWRLGSDSSALTVVASLADQPEVRVEFSAELESIAGDSVGGEPGRPAIGEADATSLETSLDRGASAGGDPAPVARTAPVVSWTGGGFNTCRVGQRGAIRCWGSSAADSGDFGVLGDSIWYVAAGLFHTCGISVASTVGCWAASEDANDRAIVGEWSIPGSGDPVELAVGAEHVCARTDTGRVFCWGSGSRGQLGVGAQQQVTGPVAVDGVNGVVQLVSGWFHTCALTDGSSVFCWGANEAGQLGIGVPGNQSRPVPVDHQVPFSSIAAGSKRSCGLDRNGGVWCWGDNQAGALGTDAVSSADVPRRLDTDVAFAALTVGGAHTCGLTRAGRAWCWGQNVFGQLGTGTTEDSPVPVPVTGGIRFSFLISGGAHTCGESVEGDLYCWGNNFSGQLGDGTQENSRTPVMARS